MKPLLFLMIGAGFATEAFAAFTPRSNSPASLAMGGTAITFPSSSLRTVSNPGLLSLAERSFSFSFSPGAFGLKELSSGAVLYVEPTGIGTFSFGGSSFGTELYRELVFSLSAGWVAGSGFSAGITLEYFHLGIEGYGTDDAFGLTGGVIAQFGPDLTAGCTVRNLNRPVIGSGRERLPREFRFSILYRPIPDLAMTADLVKDVLYPFDTRLGVAFRLLDEAGLRGGLATEPAHVSGGFWIAFGSLVLDYGLSLHPLLGWSHQAALTLQIAN